jgi:hypothetical protein
MITTLYSRAYGFVLTSKKTLSDFREKENERRALIEGESA